MRCRGCLNTRSGDKFRLALDEWHDRVLNLNDVAALVEYGM